MTSGDKSLCRHCLLPVGPRAMQRMVEGEACAFCCYGCSIAYQVKSGRTEESEAAWLLIRLGIGAFLSMNIMLFSLLLYAGAFTGADAAVLPSIYVVLWLFATPAVIILGQPFLSETWQLASQGRLTSSALIVLGVASAYLYSAFAVLEGGPHVYFDTAGMVLMFFTVGRYLEAEGRAWAARDLYPLLAAENEWATVIDGETELRRPARDVTAGMLVRVRPGERIPVDGTVVEGESHIDEAVITGESRPIVKIIGAAVTAGSVNLDGPLLIRSGGAGSATLWAQICRSVRAALSHQSRIQSVSDRVVGLFVPFVLALGVLTVLYWARHLPFDRALLIGLSVLVVACPCAVGLAAPLATSLGIGRLARCGCLVRDPGVFEVLARMRLVAFDKTGTLTKGSPQLVDIAAEAAEPAQVLAYAAGLECHSEHALAGAIVRAAQDRNIEPVAANRIHVVPGRGIRGQIDGRPAAAGNLALMRELGWPLPPALAERARGLETGGHSTVYVGWSGRIHGLLALDDTVLTEARTTLSALRDRGLRLTLLTGDLPQAAHRVGAAVGIDDIEAGLLPQAKCAALAARQRVFGGLAMVGDGLNDGPVLAAADVGIAVGSATDLARETASLVLPAGGLWLLPWVIDLSRAVRRTILTNLAWAFGYNLIALTLAVLGLLQPILAAALMAGSSILVVLNSLRLERLSDPLSAPSRGPGQRPPAESLGGIPMLVRRAIE